MPMSDTYEENQRYNELLDRAEAKIDPIDFLELERNLERMGSSLQEYATFIGKKEQQRKQRKGRSFTPITIKDIREFPDPQFLIDNVLVEGTITLLGGYAGKGKTLLALSLMLSVLDGFPWLGRYNVNRTGSVLLINEESPSSVLKTYTTKIPENAPFYALHFEEVRIDRVQDQAALAKIIQVLNPVLVVIDSLIRVHGHEEDSAGEMARVIGYLRKFTNDGATILLLHHHNKGNGPLETRARGSSDIPAGVDLELALYEKKEQLILQSVKSRFKPFEPIILEIIAENGVPEFRLAKSVDDVAREAILDNLNGESVDLQTIRRFLEDAGVEMGVHKLRRLLGNMQGRDLEITSGPHGKKMYSSFKAI
jgi:archaellum biogenesis ATPase FlaH